MNRIIIFANGELPSGTLVLKLLRPDDYFICADGGTRHALALNIKPNLIIGDMDSTEKDRLQELIEAGTEIELFPRDKNETDLELAINRALGLMPAELVIVAGLGGRMDQTLANISLLSGARLSTVDVRLDDGVEEIFLCRDQASVHGRVGDLVSLIPWGVPVEGVETRDLKWPLNRETLYPDRTRGISNEMVSEMATIKIRTGLLLVVHRRQS